MRRMSWRGSSVEWNEVRWKRGQIGWCMWGVKWGMTSGMKVEGRADRLEKEGPMTRINRSGSSVEWDEGRWVE